MRGSQRDIQAILATDGVIARREHPELRGAIAWMVRIGELVPVLPGVYAGRAMAVSVETRIRAVGRWDCDAVLTVRLRLASPSGQAFGFPSSAVRFATTARRS